MSCRILLKLAEEKYSLKVAADSYNLRQSEKIEIHKEEPVKKYEGPYEFTPGPQAQRIEIANMKATDNITINPIPKNYGLITWNGSILTVS